MKTLKVSHESQRHVRNSQGNPCAKRWEAERGSMGEERKQQKEMKNQQGKKEFLTFCMRTEGGHQRQTWYTQQAKISELNRGDSSANSGQAGKQTFSHIFHNVTQHHPNHPLLPFWKKRHYLCRLPLSVGETLSCGKGCNGDAAGLGCQPSRTGDVPLGEPSAGSADYSIPSWQRCGDLQCVVLMSAHPSCVLEQQRFRHLYCFKLASE